MPRSLTSTPTALRRRDASSALNVSALSVAWTLASTCLAIAIGIRDDAAVLIAFGAVGAVDAVGSVALVHHFRQGLRHDELSDRLEKVAHQIVLVGLLVVGTAAALGGAFRLAASDAPNPTDAGAVLAAVSLVALVALASRKLQVARRVSSAALVSDGRLSAVGATLAAVALAGTLLTRVLDWAWADAVATILVGAVAASIAIATWRSAGAS